MKDLVPRFGRETRLKARFGVFGLWVGLISLFVGQGTLETHNKVHFEEYFGSFNSPAATDSTYGMAVRFGNKEWNRLLFSCGEMI